MFWGTASSSSNVPGFEDLLKEAAKCPQSDPGMALVAVLRGYRVPGLDLDSILARPGLDPRNNPSNLLAFLARIAADGAWGVNIRVRID